MSKSQPTSVHRIRFNFWLNMEKEDEEEIADKIELLKNERLFTATIREGIQLITSLRDGNLDVLFELFPWIKPEMIKQFQAMGLIPADADAANNPEPEPVESEPPDTIEKSTRTKRPAARLIAEEKRMNQLRAEQQAYEQELEKWAREREKQIAAQWAHIEREKERLAAEREKNQSTIEKKLEKLERLLIKQGNQPIDRPGQGRGSGLKPLNGSSDEPQSLSAPTLAPPPIYDDDEDADLLEVKESDGSHTNSSANFIKSVQRLMEL